ncbi:MAG: 4Fe-4S dicluster domain-containing protein [Synergistaceae bacterium]|nr:4Fe-4S dicluster domain-containing protein [Synergistaceae bacterium]
MPCTACQYCVDSCPQNIPIPKYFALYNDKKNSPPAPFYVQQVYYDNYAKTHGKASDCVECGECERHCPQRLEVIRHLKDARESFEPDAKRGAA